MREELPTLPSTPEAGKEKAGPKEAQARRPEPEWQRAFADLCAEIAWGSDPAGETVQRLLQRCPEALKASTGSAAGATCGQSTGT
jgi:hypothetical protein